MIAQLVTEPALFHNLTGYSHDAFLALWDEFAPLFQAREDDRLARMVSYGNWGGGKPTLDVQHQLLATLVWLNTRLHPNSVGQLFGVHPSTVARYRRRVLAALLPCEGYRSMPWPMPSEYKSLNELVTLYPTLQAIVELP
jgi:hypothetical protein